MDFFKNLLAMIAVFVLWYLLIAHIAYRKTDTEEKNIKFLGKKPQKPNIFYDLLFTIPNRLGIDRAKRNPNDFNEFGLIVFEGEQGSGKTSSMVEYAQRLKKKFPNAWLVSNMTLTDSKLVRTPAEFLPLDNGTAGQIVLIDELGVWWNSKTSKYLDSSITQYATTQRKNARLMLGTIQSFYMLSKDLRTQTKELISCRCILGCINICIRKKPLMDCTGELIKLKFKGIYYFIQNDELRNSYDTTEMIRTLDRFGMVEKKGVDNG